jgi:hypothetical protein
MLCHMRMEELPSWLLLLLLLLLLGSMLLLLLVVVVVKVVGAWEFVLLLLVFVMVPQYHWCSSDCAAYEGGLWFRRVQGLRWLGF